MQRLARHRMVYSTTLEHGLYDLCLGMTIAARSSLLREWLLTQLSISLTLDEECRTRHEPLRAIFELLATRVEYWQTFHVMKSPPSFLDNLMLPKLCVLSVDDGRNFFGAPLSTISSLISLSSYHLERFNITPIFLVDDEILALLETNPLLTRLRIALRSTKLVHGLSDNLISRLRPSEHGPLLLSRLTSLESQGPMSCGNRMLVDMLSERWHHVSGSEGGQMTRLFRAKIGGGLPQDVRDDSDIDMLILEGMQLEI